MIRAHHLPPLCDRSHERCAAPLKVERGAAATDGHAILFVDGLDGTMDPGPGFSELLAMRWTSLGSVNINALRAFIRRKQWRINRIHSSFFTEPVRIKGVVVDAKLLRRFLPGVLGEEIELYGCTDMRDDWRAAIGFPALNIVGHGWRVVIMGLTVPPAETFTESAEK